MTDAYCKGCDYQGYLGDRTYGTCDFILKEKRRRGCPSGKLCTEKTVNGIRAIDGVRRVARVDDGDVIGAIFDQRERFMTAKRSKALQRAAEQAERIRLGLPIDSIKAEQLYRQQIEKIKRLDSYSDERLMATIRADYYKRRKKEAREGGA